MLAIHKLDLDIERHGKNKARTRPLEETRRELQSALQERNAELLNRWEKGILYGHFCAAELARFEQSSQHEYEISHRDRGSAVAVPVVRHVAKRARILRPVRKKKNVHNIRSTKKR